MPGHLTLHPADADGIAELTIANPGKRNAMDRAMWAELRRSFEHLQALPGAQAPLAVVVAGEGGQFASGGDIGEFASFRFDEDELRAFHESEVAPALHAMLACDITLYARIEGACVGGGLEIAACCDIRVAADDSRFGAPIGKLGFPMAPAELQILAGAFGQAALREMLLEGRLVDAPRAWQLGLVHAVVPAGELKGAVHGRAKQAALMSPQAARINKRTLRHIAAGGPTPEQRHAHFAYAPAEHHREGVSAFVEKRPPLFQRG